MFIALSIGVFAFVFGEILTSEGNIFAFYGRWLARLDDRGLDYIAKPLGYCPRCFAGQLALWGYFFLSGYNLASHIFFIAWAIFFAEIITVLYGKIRM